MSHPVLDVFSALTPLLCLVRSPRQRVDTPTPTWRTCTRSKLQEMSLKPPPQSRFPLNIIHLLNLQDQT